MDELRTNPPPDPLPDGWIMHRSRSQTSYSYYFNQFTGECTWDPPYVAPKLSQLEGLKETLASLTRDTVDDHNESAIMKQEGDDNGSGIGADSGINDNAEVTGRSKSSVRSILKKPEDDAVLTSNSSASTNSKSSRKRSHHHSHESSKRAKGSSSMPEKVRTLHILKKHRDSRRPSSWRQARITISRKEAVKELLELITILQDVINDPKELRATFEELAKTESDCPSAKRGGDLGFFGRKKMQPNFEKASFALGVGEMSDVVETSSGVHVILRLA